MSISAEYASPQSPPQSPKPQGFRGGIAALADNRLYALQNPFALDGRVSSYPASARGFSVANSYLLTQPDAAMLIDTGFGKDEPVIRGQVESLIAPGLPLSMFPLRLNEFMSINNVESFAGHFNVETCYTSNIDAALWFDFGAKAEGRDILKSMKVTAVTRADTIELGKEGRAIDVMQAPIRLIATRWLYDRATRTLFSSDMFTHIWRDTATGPWIVDETDNDSTSLRDVRSFMLNTRYWWLEGAPTDTIRRGIGNVFDKYDIECIAPGYGCILRGRNVVARHYAMLDEFLESLRQERGGVALRHPRRGALTMLDKPQSKSMLDTPVAQRMPREIAPGVFWIGDCLAQRHKGKSYHGYNAAYLVAGDRRLDPGRDRASEGFSGHRAAPERAVRPRRGAAQISVRHPPGDAALRRPRPHPEKLSRCALGRRRQRLSPGLPAIRTPHAFDAGGRRDRSRRPHLDGGRAGDPRPAHHLVGL